jgi:hypothetical protein
MAVKHFEEFVYWLDDHQRNKFDSAVVTSIEITDELDILREFIKKYKKDM